MTAKETIRKYIERFGGYPAFLMMGMSDEEVAALMQKALETGKEIEINAEPDCDY